MSELLPPAHSIPSHLRYQIYSRIKVELRAWHLRLLLWSILSGIQTWDIRAPVCITTTLLLWISLFPLHLSYEVRTMLPPQTPVRLRSVVIYRKKASPKMQRDPRPSKIRTCFLPVESSARVHAGHLPPVKSNHRNTVQHHIIALHLIPRTAGSGGTLENPCILLLILGKYLDLKHFRFATLRFLYDFVLFGHHLRYQKLERRIFTPELRPGPP